MSNELQRSKTWFNRSKTYRAKSLDQLKQLYSAGIHATLETQPETPWEEPTAQAEPQDVQPGSEPKGIDHATVLAKKKRKRKQAPKSSTAEGS